MINFQPVRDRTQAASLVQQVVDSVTQAIQTQSLLPGMTVPSIRAFAQAYEVSTFTVANAYQRLVSQGWLTARAGAGYRVTRRDGSASPAAAVLPWKVPGLNATWLLSDIFADHSIPIKAGCGWLPGEWLNEGGLHQALRHVGRVPAAQLAGYGHPYGYAPLRESVAEGLGAYGMRLEVSQVLLTQGVTHGLDLVVRTLLSPGDTVIVEQPCYANLLELLRLARLRVVTVPRTQEGLDCEALARTAAACRPRALFVNSILQNPTGASLTMANAFRLLQIAEQYDLWVIEDDISRELYRGVAPMLGALDGARRVVTLGGYSKTISPSMRVGYVAGDRDLIRELARTKMAVGLTSPEIMERAVHQVIREGHYHAHIARMHERLALAHSHAGHRLREHGFDIWAEPGAGLFLWAALAGEWRERGANGLAERALEHGIWLAPGSYFEASATDTPWIRFNVAYADRPELWRFMREAGATSRP